MNKQVMMIAYRMKKDKIEYLLLKRIPSKGGFWQPPCGQVENDESLLMAALRELGEETGVYSDINSDVMSIHNCFYKFIINKHYLTGKAITPIIEFVYAARIRVNTRVSIRQNKCEEHSQHKWVDYATALRMLKWSNNKTALKILHKKLVKIKEG